MIGRQVLLVLLASFLIGPGFAQEAPKTSDHPLFSALTGEWSEQGALVPGPGAAPIQGGARSVAKPAFGGLWIEQEGIAEYGPVKWEYRWMYRLLDGGRVFATYVDSIGQYITLQANLADGGKSTAQLTVQEDGSLLIQNLNTKPDGSVAVRYQATAKKGG